MIQGLLLAVCALSPQGDAVRDRIQDFSDLERLSYPPQAGERSLFFSSWDRASAAGPDSDDWLAANDRGHYLRVETGADGPEHVLAEHAGPGVVQRIWTAEPEGRIRIYVDGAAEPAIDRPFAELFDGEIPFAAPISTRSGGGASCFVPIPFASSLKITASSPDLVYEVAVRALPDGASIESFDTETFSAASDDWSYLSERILGAREVLIVPDHHSVLAGRMQRGRGIQLNPKLGQGGAVIGVEIIFLNPEEVTDWADVLRSMRFQVNADNKKPIDVDVPLGDFFGIGPQLREHRGYFTRVEFERGRVFFRSYFHMPFDRGTVVRLRSDSVQKPQVRLRIFLSDGEHSPLRFKAAFRNWNDLSGDPQDLVALDTTGPGRLVGSTVVGHHPAEGLWAAGDPKVFVDGAEEPSVFGTGMAHWLGFVEDNADLVDHALFARTSRAGDAGGYSSMQRMFLTDWVPFQESLRLVVEGGHETGAAHDLAVTTYWYAPSEATSGLPPLEDPEARAARDGTSQPTFDAAAADE